MLSVYCKILLQLSNISLINSLGSRLDIDYFILNRAKILWFYPFFGNEINLFMEFLFKQVCKIYKFNTYGLTKTHDDINITIF